MGIALGIFCFVTLGASTIASGASALHRLGGGALIAAGLLLLTSYVLRFVPASLADEHWNTSRSRRATRAVLKYAWVAFFVLAVCAWLVSLAL